MDEKQEYYVRKRSRSVAIVVRDGKILMENREVKTLDKERIFFENEKIMNRIIKH